MYNKFKINVILKTKYYSTIEKIVHIKRVMLMLQITA